MSSLKVKILYSIFLASLVTVAWAATRNVTPRADNQGHLGTTAFTWDAASINTGAFSRVISPLIDLAGGTAPALTIEGQIDYDTDHNLLEVQTEGGSYALPILHSETVTILKPDLVRAVSDAVLIKHFDADSFPGGVVIKDFTISTSVTCTDALNFEEWSNNGTAWTTASTVEAITLSGTATSDDGTLADSAIAAGNYLFVDLADSPTDIGHMNIVVTYYINDMD